MFGINDKMTITVINFIDDDYKKLAINYPLPLENEIIDIPDNVIKAGVFEYHEGRLIDGSVVFNIYVGNKSTFRDLLNKFSDDKINTLFNMDICSIDQQICYIIKNEKPVVIAPLANNDIVVNNVEEFKAIIMSISNEVAVIKNGIARIRSLGCNSNNTED